VPDGPYRHQFRRFLLRVQPRLLVSRFASRHSHVASITIFITHHIERRKHLQSSWPLRVLARCWTYNMLSEYLMRSNG
jgi:hypothetical protein